MNKALEVKKDIYWVGSLDYDLRVFDIIMYSDYGTTYNAYLVRGENKTVLFEIAKASFFDEHIERVKTICDPSEIDYVVVNHTEPDHTGSLAALLAINPDIEVLGTDTAIKFLKNIVNGPFNARTVKGGETLDIGGMTLQFISAPFLHWPDSMYTYIPEAKTLFTCDSFGCHFCDERVFNDVIGYDARFDDAYQYYFHHIMGPFKPNVLNALEKIKDLDIETICNGHGPVIRENPQKYIEMYREWATVKKRETPKVVIGYLTAYGYTGQLAEKVAEGLKQAGNIEVKLFNLLESKPEDVAAELSDASGLLLGSPTLIGDTLPPIWDVLKSVNGQIHKGMLAGAFGSYGWSGEAIPNIEARFKQLRFKIPVEGLKICFKPDENQLEEAVDFGRKFGEAMLGK